MESVGHGALVWPDAANLGSVGSIRWAAVAEGRTGDRNDMIAPGQNEVADETFVAVDDEVAAKLFGLFVMLDEIRGGHALEVAPCGLLLLVEDRKCNVIV